MFCTPPVQNMEKDSRSAIPAAFQLSYPAPCMMGRYSLHDAHYLVYHNIILIYCQLVNR